MIQILAIGYIAMAVIQCSSGIMRGGGDTMTPIWISLITTVIIRVPVNYGIAYLTRSEAFPAGTFIPLLISWTLGAIITTIFLEKEIGVRKLLLMNHSKHFLLFNKSRPNICFIKI